jgi:hypothetical protein
MVFINPAVVKQPAYCLDADLDRILPWIEIVADH